MRYFPDVADYPVRPLDERVVWRVQAASFLVAIQAQHGFLGWEAYNPPDERWDPYPPPKHTHLAYHDDTSGAVWAFIEAREAAQITSRFPQLQVARERPAWLTPERQRELAASMHFDIDRPTGWLAEIDPERS